MKNVPCIMAGCFARSVKRSRCEAHQLPAFETHRRERLPDDWRQRSDYILRRDQGICGICGKPGADSVDHIRAGDDHSPDNLQAIHMNPCHAQKTARDANEAKASSQPAIWGQYWLNQYQMRKEGMEKPF